MRADGAVYMSWRDWWAALRIARHRLPRLNRMLLGAGVLINVRKAGGAPTNHYALNQVLIARKMARVLGVNAADVCNAMGWNAAMQCLKTRQTITTESTLDSTLNIVVKRQLIQEGKDSVENKNDGADAEPVPGEVLALGVTESVARELLKTYGRSRVMEVAGAARSAKKPAGYFVAALRGGWVIKSPPAVEYPDEGVWVAARRESAPEPAGDLDAETAGRWAAVMHQMEAQIDRGNFERFVRGVRLARVEAGVWVVVARNVFARDALQHRFYTLARQIVRMVAGDGADVRFVIDERQEAA